ncbi:WD-containing repeat protein [Candidatus Thiomargarita nelsonii]|uniref:WD-containing repeat protein n=1 Tax=Candidatus Thiomargarita nelsonii TaxID=1003181 RepID=A0A176RZC6_9GAMM|nr:WD-containing repeat protein [Candidatus Thiomargarita nelsonii]
MRLLEKSNNLLSRHGTNVRDFLLAAYRRQCGQHGWVSGPNDGYFFEYLCMHLHSAGRDNELKLLLLDFDWIQNKLEATSVLALLNDYQWLEDKDIERVKNVLSKGGLILLKNKQELAIQLLDNLWGDESLQDNKDIQALLYQAKEAAPDWQPAFPTLNG